MFIEILKIFGSAALTAAATIFALYLKRKWDKEDKSDATKNTTEKKIDELTKVVSAYSDKVDRLSADFEREIGNTDLKTRSLQAGVREILYDRIKFLSRKYINEGEIREEEYKSLKRMWNVYHQDLDGNGFLDGEMSEIEKLEKK